MSRDTLLSNFSRMVPSLGRWEIPFAELDLGVKVGCGQTSRDRRKQQAEYTQHNTT